MASPCSPWSGSCLTASLWGNDERARRKLARLQLQTVLSFRIDSHRTVRVDRTRSKGKSMKPSSVAGRKPQNRLTERRIAEARPFGAGSAEQCCMGMPDGITQARKLGARRTRRSRTERSTGRSQTASVVWRAALCAPSLFLATREMPLASVTRGEAGARPSSGVPRVSRTPARSTRSPSRGPAPCPRRARSLRLEKLTACDLGDRHHAGVGDPPLHRNREELLDQF